ncbi:MAG: MBL fold metallo-hydrolase [Gemmatimonadetes bacterium]|nr:MBL fold metallo-hydrolase [Gemmatimonadota bacterium]NIO31670.1 MBL fold metallo-hydrolase [Gemmatimonadota bacterium]
MRTRAFTSLALILLILVGGCEANGQATFQEDVIPTAAGNLTITFIGHGTLMFRFDGKVVHVDPVGREADYSTMPDADLVLVTHEHGDHLDPDAIAAIRTEETVVIYSPSCEGRVDGAIVMENGETRTEASIGIEAIPAYNLVHMRSSGQPYHPKGNGNGYVITFGDTRVFVAGDTENTPEMKALEDIDIAFLPMNLPYTMTPEMVAEAARAFRPKILYPYHFGRTDPNELVQLLEGVEGIEIRIREMS